MQRICGTLQANGYDVTLIGRSSKKSSGLTKQAFEQKRLFCIFETGPLFYIEYNFRLFFRLLILRADAVCAIDLDTVLPVYFASVFRQNKRVYDAHEYFTQMKEIVTRPRIQKIWLAIERFAVPRFPRGYTVNHTIADIFLEKYKVHYGVVYNFAKLDTTTMSSENGDFILYQGAVNEGREFETLIPAMQYVQMPLHIYGSGNFVEPLKTLIAANNVENKVKYFGKVTPAELKRVTPSAYMGILLMDRHSLNNYCSLANRFTDYMMAGIPQICVDYPEYRKLNDQYGFADLVDELTPENLAAHINTLVRDKEYHALLRANAIKARPHLCWEQQEKNLLDFYQNNIQA